MNRDVIDLATKTLFVDALLACPTMRDRNTRDVIVDRLTKIRERIPRSDTDRIDVANVLDRALDFQDGLPQLIEVLRFYEGDSLPMHAVSALYTQHKNIIETVPSNNINGAETNSSNYWPISALILILLAFLLGLGWLAWQYSIESSIFKPESTTNPLHSSSDIEKGTQIAIAVAKTLTTQFGTIATHTPVLVATPVEEVEEIESPEVTTIFTKAATGTPISTHNLSNSELTDIPMVSKATPTAIEVTPTKSDIPIYETFDSTVILDWESSDGRWKVVSKRLTVINYEDGLALMLIKHPEWSQYTIQLDFGTIKYLDDSGDMDVPFSHFNVAFNLHKGGDGYWFSLTNGGVSCSISLEGEQLKLPLNNEFSTGEFMAIISRKYAGNHTIKIVARKDQYSILLNDKEICSFQDDTYAMSGILGVAVTDGASGRMWIDNVRIAPYE